MDSIQCINISSSDNSYSVINITNLHDMIGLPVRRVQLHCFQGWENQLEQVVDTVEQLGTVSTLNLDGCYLNLMQLHMIAHLPVRDIVLNNLQVNSDDDEIRQFITIMSQMRSLKQLSILTPIM